MTTDTLYPEELRLLATLNVQPTDVTRKSAEMFDVSFTYEKRWLRYGAASPQESKTKSITARAWLVLFVIKLAYERHTDEVCHMMWGRTLPDYAGDWSFIRDARDDEQWRLFETVGNKFFVTPELAERFAQP